MKVGVTGSDGFVGSHLLKYFEIKGYDAFGYGNEYDLLDSATTDIIAQENDIIYHIAGVNKGPEAEMIRGNIVTTLNLANSMGTYATKGHPKKIIYASTIHVARFGKATPYSYSKLTAEDILCDVKKYYPNLKVEIYRIHNVFGEGCKPNYNSYVTTLICNYAKTGKTGWDKEKGDNKLTLIYIDDLVKELAQSCDMLDRSKITVTFSGKEYTLREVVHTIQDKNLRLNSRGFQEVFEYFQED